MTRSVIVAFQVEALCGRNEMQADIRKRALEVLNMLMAPWRGDAGKQAYLRQVAEYDDEFTAQLETLYPIISVPTQIMWAEHDAWVDPDFGRKLHDLIPGSTFELMEDAGHFAMEDIPGRIAARIGSFASAIGNAQAAMANF